MSQRTRNNLHLHAVNADQMRVTHNALPLDVRHASIEAMNGIVAQMIDLALAAKHAHWNVRGPSFQSHHQLFDKVHAALGGEIDAVGERVAALGGIARGTLQTVAGATMLPPYPVLSVAEAEHTSELALRLGKIGSMVRSAAIDAGRRDDIVTADILTDTCTTIDGLLWLLESHGCAGQTAVPRA
jgi:starvation-inducible DNA-binding protein